MTSILTKNSSVYGCDVCGRNVRVPQNQKGLEIIQRCIITANCKGKLHPILDPTVINSTPTFPPEVAGVQDWTQREVLFTFNQTINAVTWKVQHNLATNPIVNVYINQTVDGKTVLVRTAPLAVNIIDDNNLDIVFAEAESGTVQCIALASKNTVNPTMPAAAPATTIQVTNTGQLTLAFLVNPGSITMTFNSSASPTPVNITYPTSLGTSESPWNGTTVFINGRTYVTRNFNVVDTNPAPPIFSAGLIANGSTLFFQGITATGQALLLLANAPYAAADRIYNQYIDLININITSPQLFYTGGDVYAQTSVLKNTYPPIIVV